MKGYPRGFVALIYATVGVLWASGFLLAPTTLDFRLDIAVPWRLPADGRLLVAALHVILSYTMLMLVGAVWQLHMRIGWRRRANLRAGGALLLALLILGVSGVAVFYLGGEMSSRCAALTHLLIGVVLPLILIIHVVTGRAMARVAGSA